jgi:hypothetical protein
MTVLRPVVQSFTLAVFDPGHHCAPGSAIAGQFIGDHHPWSDALLLEQLAQQALGRFDVATTLNQNVEHNPVLVDGSPKPMLPPRDADDNLIEMPLISGV